MMVSIQVSQERGAEKFGLNWDKEHDYKGM
jgi:hypothetical protein